MKKNNLSVTGWDFYRTAYMGLALAVFSVLSLILYPTFLPASSHAADNPEVNPSITVGNDGALAFTVDPGQFNHGSQEITVSTSNYTGYELTIAPSTGVDTSLVNSETESTIPTITLPSGEDSITQDSFSSPSYGFSLNATDYKPVENGTVINHTNTAGTDNLTFTIGAKVAGNTPAGTYSKTFTLTALANEAVFSITYNENTTDAIGNMPASPQTAGEVSGNLLELASEIPTRTGYTFLGWDTNSSATTATYSAGGDFNLDQTTNNTVALYAIWEVNTYEITLDGNVATTSGSASATATYGSTTLSSITNPARKYTVSGFTLTPSGANATVASSATLTSTYTFDGWFEEAGAINQIASNSTTPVLEANTTYTDLNGKWISTSNSPITLYAGWTASSVKLPAITRDGSTCGWATSSTATSWTYRSGASIVPSANLVLYGVCRTNLTLDGNGATTAGSASTTVVYGATTLGSVSNNPARSYTVSGFTLTPSGANATVSSTSNLTATYTFDGWYQEATATHKIASSASAPALSASTAYTNSSKKWTYTTAGAITLYAGWTGGSVTLPTITRTGSTCGWATSSTATAWTYDSGASFTPTEATTLYGVCQTSITLNKNGATNNPTASTTATYNATSLAKITTLPARSYTVSGFTTPAGNHADGATVSSASSLTATYTFNGWYKESGATNKIASNAATPALSASTAYTDSGSKWTYTTAGAITLYAGWTSASINLPTITKPGYTCGWTTTSTGATSITYQSGATLTPSATTTLYGVCVAIDYTITVTAGNGISSLALSGWTGTGTATLTKTYHIGDTINLSSFTPTYKTAYDGAKYIKNDSVGSLSGSTYTVGAGNGNITISASSLSAPTCVITGGTTKVYNRSATTLTATSVSDSYDTDSTNITYSFGNAANDSDALGGFTTPSATNTTSVAKAAFRGTKYYGVTIVVTDKNDSSITNTCTSGTGTETGGRTAMALVNSRINFNANGGTIAGGNNPLYVYYGAAYNVYYTGRTNTAAATWPTITPPTGYSFIGWWTTADDTGVKVVNADATLTSTDISGWTNASNKWVKTSTSTSASKNILYAHYSANTYTITLNGNGATTAGSTSATATYDSTTLSSITNPQRSYTASGFTLTPSGANATVSATTTLTSTYTFNGWYKESGATNKIASNATTPVLEASTSYTDAEGKWTSTSGQTLYAGWTGGSITLPTITRTGSTCGWATSNTATSWTYNSGASVAPTGNLTLYGVCRTDITLNKNNATNSPTTSTTATYNATSLAKVTTLPTRSYTVSGFTLTPSGANATVSATTSLTATYTFAGWYKEAAATNKIASNAATPALQASTTYTDANKKWTYTTAGAITLYAGWTGGSVTLPTITRTGSTCGWATSDSATSWTYNSGASMTPTAATVLYGVCRTDITLNKNGGSGGSGSTTATYGATTLATITNPTRANSTGTRTVSGFTLTPSGANATVSSTSQLSSTNTTTYTFAGWYKESGATNKIASNATTPALQASTTYTDANKKWTYTTAGAITLYAGWTASAGDYSAVTLPTITRTGSTCGWATSNTATSWTYNSGASVTPTGNLILYGVCRTNITLNKNGATNSPTGSTTATYNATSLAKVTTLPTRSYTVSGFTLTPSGANATVSATTSLTATYTFAGWYSEDAATTKVASNAATPALQASTTYTDANSKWTYTTAGAITLYAGWSGGSVTLPTITRTGSTCGWSTSSTATSWTYNSGASMTPTAATVLYGVCRTNITLNKNGATNSPTGSTTATYNATSLAKVKTLPTRSYAVSGFTLTPSGANATVSATTSLTATYTFAGWYKEAAATNKIASNAATPALQASTTYTDANKKWTYTTAGAITLYAGWTGGSVTLPTITRTGSTCGWSTSSTATAITYASGASLTPTAATTLYGVCVTNITLNKNGGTNSPTTSTTATYGATTLGAIATLPQRKYTVSGFTTPAGNNADSATVSSTSNLTSTYTFNGWYKESGATNKIASNAATPALQASTTYTDANKKWTYTTAGAITLYAGWSSKAVTLPTITKTGYTCGWTTTATGATSITYASGASMTPTAATTLYGVCTVNKYTCTKRYALQKADGTYPSYTTETTEQVNYGDTCSYSKSVTDYQTKSTSGTMTESGLTLSLKLPRNTYKLTINKNDTYISSVSGAGNSYRWGQAVSISATASIGGKFKSWSQTSGTTGTFGSTSSASTTFTMGKGAATIYADGEIGKIYMQDVNNAQCSTLASDQSITVYDKRDEKQYTIRYFGDQCWMTSNLRFTGTSLSTTTSNVSSDVSNIDWHSFVTEASSDSGACYGYYSIIGTNYRGSGWTTWCKEEGTDINGDPIVWYNYAAASAGTVAVAAKSSDAATSSLCPSGWRLPNHNEVAPLNTIVTGDGDYTFNGAFAGHYEQSNLLDPTYNIEWWLSDTNDPAVRYCMFATTSSGSISGYSISTFRKYRHRGYPLRCVTAQ